MTDFVQLSVSSAKKVKNILYKNKIVVGVVVVGLVALGLTWWYKCGCPEKSQNSNSALKMSNSNTKPNQNAPSAMKNSSTVLPKNSSNNSSNNGVLQESESDEE